MGITQSELARRSGFSREHIRRLIAGESGSKVEGVDAIARALNADVNEARIAAGYAPATETESIPVMHEKNEGEIRASDSLTADMIFKLTQEVGFLTRRVDALEKDRNKN